ncbi:MAG: hypothetical protein SVU69_12780 [Pseudomonadota bacterium]|nr:hypothetical protein [Pseudomonadota bacterium]
MMSTITRTLVGLGWVVSVLVAGCANNPVTLEQQRDAADARHRASAQAFEESGDLANALIQWQIIQTLSPADGDAARSIVRLQSDIAEKSSEFIAQGQRAQRSGERSRAKRYYLQALALAPHNEVALKSLREMDYQLAKRRATTPTHYHAAKPTQSAQKLKQAQQLIAEGRSLDAISELEALNHLANSDATQALLGSAYRQLAKEKLGAGDKKQALAYLSQASEYQGPDQRLAKDMLQTLRQSLSIEAYEAGLRAYSHDPDKAIALWEQSLAYDSTNAEAQARLSQARRTQQLFQTLGGGAYP